MAIFLVTRTQTGPAWDAAKPMEEQTLWEPHRQYMNALGDDGFFRIGGPVGSDRRVLFVVTAESEAAVSETLARDPWHDSHLVVESIEPWDVRLGRALLGDRV